MKLGVVLVGKNALFTCLFNARCLWEMTRLCLAGTSNAHMARAASSASDRGCVKGSSLVMTLE